MSTSTHQPELDSERRLRGGLGPIAIAFMVIAAAAPLTVVGGIVPIGILIGNGLGFPVMFLVAAGILLLFAVGLTTMAPFVPKSASFFTFITRGLGTAPGVASAWLAVVCYSTVQISVFSYLGATISQDIVILGGPEIPWWAFTFAAMAIVGVLGYRHIELSSKVLFVLLALEMGIAIVLGLVILATGGADGVTGSSFLLQQILSGSPALGLMFAIASFIGFESTVVFRDEARDPERTIPRATYAAALIIGVFYAFVAWALILGVGEANVFDEAGADPTTFLARVTGRYLGVVGEVVIAVLFLGSMFACVLALHNVLARYHHAMANARLLPYSVGRVHPIQGSPHRATVVQIATVAIVTLLLILVGVSPISIFTWFAGIGTLAIIILMAATCLAVVAYFARTREVRSPWRVWIAPLLGFAGLAVSAVLIFVNFPLLVGDVDEEGTPVWGTLSIVLAGVVVAAIVLGVAHALVLRATRPDIYRGVVGQFDAVEAEA